MSISRSGEYCSRIAQVTIATLCSSASYRDGLLSILEAGLERFTPDIYPATVAPVLVVRIDFQSEDFNRETMLRVIVEHDDGERFSEVGFAVVYTPPPEVDPQLTYYWVLIHPLPLQLRRDGLHRVHLTLDGHGVRQIPFVAVSRLPQV